MAPDGPAPTRLSKAFHRTERQAFRGYGLNPTAHLLELCDPPFRVRALEAGTGEPALFLHGISLTCAHWAPIIARLGSRRCIAIDMPGHGESGAVDFGGVDLRRWHTSMLTGCLDELGIPSAHIIGHSYGGMMGMWLALDAPLRVRSVVSIGVPSIAFGARPDIVFRAAALPGLGPLMLQSPMPGFAHRAILGRALGRGAITAAPRELLRLAYLATRRRGFATTASTYLREQFRGARALPRRYRLTDTELARIEQPVLIVWGEEDDRYQPVEQGRQKASLIPHARFEPVPGGHEPWLDDPESCAAAIGSFLERVRASAAA
jgi:pimeloyl-[acyl-carrier protein] methyl ester esterase